MPTNTEKRRTGKYKAKNVVSTSEKKTCETNTCLLHGPGHSYEDCNLLKEYSKKYTAQRPHKENEAHSSGKTKRGKSAEFDGNVREVSIM